VKATDGDTARNSPVSYFLSGNPANNHHFSIDASTGELFVLKPLDRQMQKGSEWRFTVFAADEKGYGLLGYAEVVVSLKDSDHNLMKL
ncbi:neural-cadherin-like protein, partial [Leptotrombidium deliense]